MILRYGDIPVPHPVMWSEESEYFVGECPYFKGPAICQREAQGQGVPKFGRPHTIRQRRAMALVLCDVCNKPLRNATKISLSNFGPDYSEGHVLSQVEPLLHAECARLSIEHCPALQRQLSNGRMRVRKVFQCAPKPTVASAEERASFVPDYSGADIIGLAVMELRKWRYISQASL
jgi:hypothetical protein